MKIQFYTNGLDYIGAIEHSKALDIKSRFKLCPEFGIKKITNHSNLMLIREYWKFKEEIQNEGYQSTTLNEIVNKVFPNGYTFPTFAKFLLAVLGHEGFISFIINSVTSNEDNPETQAAKELKKFYYVIDKKVVKRVM